MRPRNEKDDSTLRRVAKVAGAAALGYGAASVMRGAMRGAGAGSGPLFNRVGDAFRAGHMANMNSARSAWPSRTEVPKDPATLLKTSKWSLKQMPVTPQPETPTTPLTPQTSATGLRLSRTPDIPEFPKPRKRNPLNLYSYAPMTFNSRLSRLIELSKKEDKNNAAVVGGTAAGLAGVAGLGALAANRIGRSWQNKVLGSTPGNAVDAMKAGVSVAKMNPGLAGTLLVEDAKKQGRSAMDKVLSAFRKK